MNKLSNNIVRSLTTHLSPFPVVISCLYQELTEVMAVHCVIKTILLCLAVSWVRGAPASKLPCKAATTKSLLHQLGEHRRPLQAFSPWPLCNNAMRKVRATVAARIDAAINSTKQFPAATILGNLQEQEFWGSLEGCTAEDVNLLLINLPEASSTCSWTIKCDYDRQRFPQVLYQAKLTLSSMAAIACNCRPVVRDVAVLREVRVGMQSCPKWRLTVEPLTIAYDCNTVDIQNVDINSNGTPLGEDEKK